VLGNLSQYGKIKCKDRKGKQMSKAKVIKKLLQDGAKFEESFDNTGAYVFEAWLPDGKIWDNDYRTGMLYNSMDQFNTKAELWADVWRMVSPEVIDQA
jgi:hypothetical protein